jgi:hypothetical protein
MNKISRNVLWVMIFILSALSAFTSYKYIEEITISNINEGSLASAGITEATNVHKELTKIIELNNYGRSTPIHINIKKINTSAYIFCNIEGLIKGSGDELIIDLEKTNRIFIQGYKNKSTYVCIVWPELRVCSDNVCIPKELNYVGCYGSKASN